MLLIVSILFASFGPYQPFWTVRECACLTGTHGKYILALSKEPLNPPVFLKVVLARVGFRRSVPIKEGLVSFEDYSIARGARPQKEISTHICCKYLLL